MTHRALAAYRARRVPRVASSRVEAGVAVTKGNSDSPGVRGAAIQQAGQQGLLFGDDVAARPE